MAWRAARRIFEGRIRLSSFFTAIKVSGKLLSASSSLIVSRHAFSTSVESRLLGNLKQQFHEVSKMNPPPKISPPRPFTLIKGALDNNGPVLSRSYNDEDIKVSVMYLPESSKSQNNDASGDSLDELFLMVIITKGNKGRALQFLCDLYPDALSIVSISLRDISGISDQDMLFPSGYEPNFSHLNQDLQLAFRKYLDDRGINEDLFRFLQAWLYAKEHRKIMQWLKTAGGFISK
eukprot:TRINITY_DN3531_c0_g1_i1.p1 TRINITY_DN3531_c0_g1~~TRINITY_DN3531_c0_g1_i1.p1  ORF type:complete len:234 (-),score=37.68 TRINITY_DN3531_c0_g1_i1:243-944(-)